VEEKKESKSSSSSSRRQRGSDLLAGEKDSTPPASRRHKSVTPARDDEESDEEDSKKSKSAPAGKVPAKSRRPDTPWDGTRSKRNSNRILPENKKNVAFADLSVDEQATDSDDEFYLPVSQNRHHLKPPVFNGTGNFETFHARFLNCVRYNNWSSAEHLAHLRNSLTDEAGQVLWDSGPEVTNSLSRLTRLLKDRYGGAAQSDRYRMELRSRIRQPQETLISLHRDIKKLIALGYPELDPKAREVIAIDRFVDSLGDANLALKIRERTPATLDEALQAGLRQEVWNRDSARLQPEASKPKAVRAVEEDLLKTVNQKIDQLQKQVDQVSRRQVKPIVLTTVAQTPAASPVAPAENKPTTPTTTNAATGYKQQDNPATPVKTPNTPSWFKVNRRPTPTTPGKCWSCGATDHQQANCPNKSPEKDDRPLHTMPIRKCENEQQKAAKVYLNGHIKTHAVNVLLDTGSDVSLAPYEVIEKNKCRLRRSDTVAIKAANGSDVAIAGEATLPFRVAGKLLHTVVLVSKDVSEIILGSGWLRQHNCDWEFSNDRIRFGPTGDWIMLTGRSRTACCREYLDQDITVEPHHMQLVPARATLFSPRRTPPLATIEPRQLKKGVYIGRTLIPPKHDEARVCIMNTTARPVLVPAGTRLGHLQDVEVLENTAGTESPENLPDQSLPETAQPSSASLPTPAKPTDDSVIPKLMDSLPDELSADQRKAARHLFEEYNDVFSKNEFDIGRTPLVECHIDTGNSRPIRQPLRRQPHKHMEAIDDHVNEMLRHGVIEPAASPWASNVVLVSKKDGSLRFCVDYRAVNAVTYKDAYPLPLIDNCINAMSGSSWFSTLDLRAGYHNIPVAEVDRDKTAFVTRRGCWRYTVMPFGLTCSPSVFQRLMDMVLHGLSYDICLVYLDDIIIFAASFEEQLRRLESVLQRLRWAKLKLKPSKCKLLQRKVEFLGHVISEAGVEMQTSKIDAVVQWPRPRNTHELRSYMGLCSYYRRFIAGFADTAAPLHALTGKGVQFQWGPEQEAAFIELKEKLTTAPVLGMPENTGQYILDSDASDVGLGAVLSQIQDGEERVIAYASRTLQRPERNYETTKKELLAVVYGLKQFRQYLLGRPIIIRVDHAALTWLKRTAEPLPQLARWLTFIEGFDYQIVHRAGRKHGNADPLSRRPDPDNREDEDLPTPAVHAVHRDERPVPKPRVTRPRPTRVEAVNAVTTTPSANQPASQPASAPLDRTTPTPATLPAAQFTPVQNTNTPRSANRSQRPRRSLVQSSPAPQYQWDELAAAQLEDDDLRYLLQCRTQSDVQPAIESMLTASKTAKRL